MNDFISELLASNTNEAISLMPQVVVVVRERDGWRGFESIKDMIVYYKPRSDDHVYWENVDEKVKYF